MNDFKLAARRLSKSPGFAAVAILSLALGIGSATGLFSLINAILLRSLPVPNPQELRVLQWTGVDARLRSISGHFETRGNRSTAESFSPALFDSFREKGAGLADIFAFAPLNDSVARAQREAFPANGMIVSDNFFSALRVSPRLGRVFAPGDTSADAGLQAVISHEWWEKHFAGEAGVLGQPLHVNGTALSIIGVLPRGFDGVRPGSPCGFYVLLTPDSPYRDRAVSVADHWWLRLMARARPGASSAALESLLGTVLAAGADGQIKQPEMLAQPGGGGLAFDRNAYGKPLLLLLAITGVVLLIACANVAGLLLARNATRQHEMSVRAALGAGGRRLLGQSLAESLLLALAGGGLGILLALWMRTAVSRLLSQSAQGLSYDFSLDLKALAFSLALSFAAALAAGLLPAWRASRADPQGGLKSRSTLGLPRLRAGRVLVAAQIALSLLLLAGAGLFVRSLINLRRIDAGFDTKRLLVFQANAGLAGHKGAALTAFYDRAQKALAAIPGVEGASVTVFPLLDNKSSSGGFAFRSRAMEPSENPQTYRLVVGETFFATLGLPILNGRALAEADSADASKVIVVNETFARQYFPNQDPVGHVISTWRTDWRIVGVCRDAKYQNIREPAPPTIYISFRQFDLRFGASFVTRTAGPPLELSGAIHKAIQSADPGVPVSRLMTQDQLIGGTISEERLFAALCAALAGIAVLLSCIGLYGLLSFNITRRANEIGIRMALGARPENIAKTILGEALLLAGIGAVAGLPLAFAAARLVRTRLYGLPADPATLFGVALALIAVALIAAWLPARRAASVDPMTALRME